MKGIFKLLTALTLVMLTFVVLAQVSRDNDQQEVVQQATVALSEAKASGDADLIEVAQKKLEAAYQAWAKQNYIDRSTNELNTGYRQRSGSTASLPTLRQSTEHNTTKAVKERQHTNTTKTAKSQMVEVTNRMPQTATYLEYAPTEKSNPNFPIRLKK